MEDIGTATAEPATAISEPSQVATRRTRSKRSEHGRTEHRHAPKQSPSMSGPKNKSISVGVGFQVMVLPGCEKEAKKLEDGEEEEDRDECMWSAKQNTGEGEDRRITEYCEEAAKVYGIDLQRALYNLHNAGSDVAKAKAVLATRIISKTEFSSDDAFAFRNAHMYFGKNFAKIRQVLPHKTMAALVEHYYLTKKQQNYKSFTDYDAVPSSDSTESNSDTHSQVKSELHQPVCEVCRHEVRKLYTVNGLELCRTCKLYFKATNKHRVCVQSAEELRRTPMCHPEMKIIADQFSEMACTAHSFEDPDGSGEMQVAQKGKTVCEQKIEEVKQSQLQLHYSTRRLEVGLQAKAAESRKLLNSVEEARRFLDATTPPATNTQQQNAVARVRSVHSWSAREKEAALHALMRFDGDCNAVADILTTKTPNMVKAFYTKHEAEIQKLIDEGHGAATEEADANMELDDELEDNKEAMQMEIGSRQQPPEVIELDD